MLRCPLVLCVFACASLVPTPGSHAPDAARRNELAPMAVPAPLAAAVAVWPIVAPAAAEPVAPVASVAPQPDGWTLDELFAALRSVECGTLPDQGRHATGDGGRALGPYQIHRAYWRDAGVPGRYEDCRDEGYARRVMLSYWSRWCPDALASVDAEILARVHNGGPRGDEKRATRPYWRRVEQALLAVRQRRDSSSSQRAVSVARV